MNKGSIKKKPIALEVPEITEEKLNVQSKENPGLLEHSQVHTLKDGTLPTSSLNLKDFLPSHA